MRTHQSPPYTITTTGTSDDRFKHRVVFTLPAGAFVAARHEYTSQDEEEVLGQEIELHLLLTSPSPTPPSHHEISRTLLEQGVMSTPHVWGPDRLYAQAVLGHDECRSCGMRADRMLTPVASTDGLVTGFVVALCPRPEGLGDTVVEIDVPSGELLVGDDLRFCTHPEDHDLASCFDPSFARVEVKDRQGPWRSDPRTADINNQPYLQAAMIATGQEKNLFWGNFTNGSVDMVDPVRDEEGQIIGFTARDDRSDQSDQTLASISCERWSWQAVDLRQYLAAGGGDFLHHKTTVIRLVPGRYRFTHHTTRRGTDVHQERLGAVTTVERVGDC